MIFSRRQLMLSALAKPNAFSLISLDLAQGVHAGAWPRPDLAILPGSLVKPFLAIAHGPPFPRLTCTGCRPGTTHGEIDLVNAIAQSCNQYFEALSLKVTHERACLAAASYGMPAPPDSVDGRIGLGRGWRVVPSQILHAYARLAANRSDGAAKLVLEGMRRCATRGTGKAIGDANVLAKTGTAPCDHHPRMPGDGLAIALWPADSPRRVVLAREHGVPGSAAAARLRGALR